MTKSRRSSKSDLTAIDFDSIDVRDVKYLLPIFDGDVIFLLPPINVDVFCTYGRSMDERGCQVFATNFVTDTLGAQQKQQISKMILDFFQAFFMCRSFTRYKYIL